MFELTVLICIHSKDDLHDEIFRRALESLNSQTYKDFKIVIVFDECHPGTKVVAFDTLDKFVHLTRHKKTGLGDAKNYGLSFINTEWVAFLDGDDIYMPKKLQKQVDFLKANPKVDILSTHYWWADLKYLENNEGERQYYIVQLEDTCFKNTMYLTHKQIVNRLPKENVLCHGSIMMRRNIFDRHLYDNHKIGYEDWDLWQRLAKAGYRFAQLPERLYMYTRNPNPIR